MNGKNKYNFTIVIAGYPISTHIWQLSTTGKSITTSAKAAAAVAGKWNPLGGRTLQKDQ